MVTVAEARVDVTPDTSGLVRACRVIAKHLTAMADELEAPAGAIELPQEWTDEQVAEFQAEWDKVTGPGIYDVRRKQ